jgi:GPH family glycoside/pentoside/hexuronide:cation symporter
MNATVRTATAPEDRIKLSHKAAYGAGAFVNNLLSAAIGGMMIILNLGLHMDPRMVGWVSALPRLVDTIIDPVMGYVSDHTRSRWGRRRPFIFVGAILTAVVFALLWQLPRGASQNFYFVWFLVGSIVFYVCYTIFIAPWVALGYELTPDYHERTRLMGTQNFIGQIAYVVSPWFLWIMNGGKFGDQIAGAGTLAITVGIATLILGVLPAIVLRERMATLATSETAAHRSEAAVDQGNAFKRNLADFFTGFASTMATRPFLKLCAATFLVFNGFILISAFSSYVIIYYVAQGDQALGSKWVGWSGTVGAVGSFAAVALVTWLGTRIGKRRAFLVSTAISMVGYALKWFCYNPNHPWLVLAPAPLLAFGLGGLFTLMPSMIADVVDTDELKTHQRREGMFSSVFWFTVKLGLSAALAASGYLLNATGFDVALGGAQTAKTITQLRLFDAFVPFLASGLAIWAVATFPITEAKAYEVRQELERRRGRAGVVDSDG